MPSKNLRAFEEFQRRLGNPTSDEALRALMGAVDPEVEFVQAPSLPHGGVHRGYAGAREMREMIADRWRSPSGTTTCGTSRRTTRFSCT